MATNKFTAAVGVVQDRDRWLVGLARNTSDDRTGKWVHPGGGIKHDETPTEAAVREVWEETGIRCKSVGKEFTMPGKPTVAFVHCRVTRRNQRLKNNHEFSALGFFTERELRGLKLYKNVLELIRKCKS